MCREKNARTNGEPSENRKNTEKLEWDTTILGFYDTAVVSDGENRYIGKISTRAINILIFRKNKMKRGHNFRELIIWKSSMELVKEVYSLTSNLPDIEKYGFKSQMNRCALSIPSNIAEGSGRTSEKEFIHFLRIALSSSYELETQLILTQDIFGLETSDLILKISTLQNQIGGFIRKLNIE